MRDSSVRTIWMYVFTWCHEASACLKNWPHTHVHLPSTSCRTQLLWRPFFHYLWSMLRGNDWPRGAGEVFGRVPKVGREGLGEEIQEDRDREVVREDQRVISSCDLNATLFQSVLHASKKGLTPRFHLYHWPTKIIHISDSEWTQRHLFCLLYRNI